MSGNLGLMEGQLLLKGLFLSDELFVFSRHEMSILHLPHRFNGVPHENGLVVQGVCIVLHRSDV